MAFPFASNHAVLICISVTSKMQQFVLHHTQDGPFLESGQSTPTSSQQVAVASVRDKQKLPLSPLDPFHHRISLSKEYIGDTSAIHTVVCMRGSCANSPHLPLCESFRCGEGGNFAPALICLRAALLVSRPSVNG